MEEGQLPFVQEDQQPALLPPQPARAAHPEPHAAPNPGPQQTAYLAGAHGPPNPEPQQAAYPMASAQTMFLILFLLSVVVSTILGSGSSAELAKFTEAQLKLWEAMGGVAEDDLAEGPGEGPTAEIM